MIAYLWMRLGYLCLLGACHHSCGLSFSARLSSNLWLCVRWEPCQQSALPVHMYFPISCIAKVQVDTDLTVVTGHMFCNHRMNVDCILVPHLDYSHANRKCSERCCRPRQASFNGSPPSIQPCIAFLADCRFWTCPCGTKWQLSSGSQAGHRRI